MQLTARARSIIHSFTRPNLDYALKRLDQHILGTYTLLRASMCLLALALPLVLVISGELKLYIPQLLATPLKTQHSLSAYYHANLVTDQCTGELGLYRNIFVAILAAISFSLVAYKGYTNREDWCLNIAGVLLALVAFFPMKWPEMDTTSCLGFKPVLLPIGSHGFSLHLAAAIAFFVALIATVLLTSTDSLDVLERGIQKRIISNRIQRDALKQRTAPERSLEGGEPRLNKLVRTQFELDVLANKIGWWRSAYAHCRTWICAPILIMIFPMVVKMFGLRFLPYSNLMIDYSMLIAEAVGIWVFSIYWGLKSVEFQQTRSGTILLSTV